MDPRPQCVIVYCDTFLWSLRMLRCNRSQELYTQCVCFRVAVVSWLDAGVCLSHIIPNMQMHLLCEICCTNPIVRSPISHNAPFCDRNVHMCAHLLQNGALWDINALWDFLRQIFGNYLKAQWWTSQKWNKTQTANVYHVAILPKYGTLIT